MEHKDKLKFTGVFFLIFSKIGQILRLAAGGSFGTHVFLRFGDAFDRAMVAQFFDLHLTDFLFGAVCVAAVHFYVYISLSEDRKKKYRDGEEHGSADWGGEKDIAPFVDPVFENNMILTQTESLTMNNRPKDPKTARNKNVLVIGGSGSGKTRFFVKPNLMQLHSSYVVTDPKGYNRYGQTKGNIACLIYKKRRRTR